MIDQLEQAVNDLSDKDWSWWPFLWLRPEKHAALSLARIMSLSLLYGVPSSMLMGLLSRSLHHAPSLGEMAYLAGAFPLLFLFIGTVVVAPMWNRRAVRLRARARVRG